MFKNLFKVSSIVTEDYNNYPLWKYLKILRPDWSKLFIIKQLRKNEILINKSKAKFNQKIFKEDVISHFMAPNNIQKKHINLSSLKALDVVYEDKNIILVNKPVKISVQTDAKNYLRNMDNLLLKHLNINLNDICWKPKFVHRLDYNTCGILLGAKSLNTFQKLSLDFKERKIIKIYKVLVFGKFKWKNIILKNYLLTKNKVVEVLDRKDFNKKGAKEAISNVELINTFKETSLLKVKIITGKKHQIRVQLSALGFSVCGDKKYGKRNALNKKFPYITLCASEISFLSDYQELKDIKKSKIKPILPWFEDKNYLF